MSKVEKLDKHWKDWTGLRILLKELDKEYLIKRVHCIKGSSQVRAFFRQKTLIEVLHVKYFYFRNQIFSSTQSSLRLLAKAICMPEIVCKSSGFVECLDMWLSIRGWIWRSWK